MSDTIFSSEKRTRSQLTLPDDILQLSQRSPLKDARTALRNNASSLADSTLDVCAEETDDELLLTSRKPNARTNFSTKRSASPSPQDEYSIRSDSPLEGRELKRLKRDLNAESDIENTNTAAHATSSTHTRSHSQPNVRLGALAQEDSAVVPLFRKPVSSSNTGPPATAIVLRGKGRAQSVPLFPSSSSVPHLDLRNPPPSPVRARSRSPSKDWEPKMRIVPGSSMIAELNSKEGSNMDVDSTEPGSVLPSEAPQLSPPRENPILPDTTETVAPLSTLGAVIGTNPSIQLPQRPPSTPATAERLLSTHLWSPLTPLPETPHPSKFSANTEERFNGIGWGTNPDEGDKEMIIDAFSEYTEIATKSKSRLPRPSNASTSAVSPAIMGPPTLSAAKTKGSTSVKPLPSLSGQLSGSTKPMEATAKQSTETPGNAFAVMMAQARLDKGEDKLKGKGKARGSFNKAASSSSGGSNIFQPVKAKGKGQMTEKVTGKEVQSKPKPSLKAKMRPKQIPKVKPVPVPIPDLAQDEFEHKSTPPNPPPLDALANYPLPPSLVISPPAIPTTTGSSNTVPRTPPPETIAPPSLPSNILDYQPEVAELKSMEDPPALGKKVADEIIHLKYPPEPQATSNPAPTTTTSKLPRAKRLPSSSTAESITRRVSSRLKGKDATTTNTAVRNVMTTKQAANSKKPSPSLSRLKPPFSEHKAPQDTRASTSSLSDVPSDGIFDNVIPPGSPMTVSSPARKDPKVQGNLFTQPTSFAATKAALSQTPSKPKAKSKSESPSPSKLSRSTSLFSVRPTALSRTFTSYGGHSGQSSLSTLSNALEKLRMPPPARPNTSMGFNRDSGSDTDVIAAPKIKSTDGLSLRGRSGQVVERTAALSSGTLARDSSRRSVNVGAAGPSQKPVSSFFSGNRASSTTRLQSGTGPIMRGVGSGNMSGRRHIFGTGDGMFGVPGRARAFQKVSRKTSLPSVMASPVKGSDAVDPTSSTGDEMGDIVDGQNGDRDHNMFTNQATIVENMGSGKSKGKERYIDTRENLASRRVSLASQALSQSLSSLPLSGGPGLGLMGPPATPVGRNGTRSASSSYPSTNLSSSTGKASDSGVIPKTRSTTGLRSAPGALGKIKGGVDGHVSSGRKKPDDLGAGSSKPVPESLKVLKDCVIFVDVRTDDGDEAGSLFVEMLEGVGARILTRVGQTCTHIVYKNGLVSTSTRYRLLRDPKPHVVGIAWVVECVEQRQRMDESKFAIDLDSINVAGVNKRRRSMLPKAIIREAEDMGSSDIDREGDGDQSMDGSSSSMIMDDDLTPLEKARRRKGAL